MGVLIGGAILVVAMVWFFLWQILVVEPRERVREERRQKWLKRQREEELGLWYGDEHRLMKAKYQKVIDRGEGRCTERICVMPSRRIAPGEFWHLAHDHVKGGPLDYLGPAHPECNEAEAKSRGVRFKNPYRPTEPYGYRYKPPVSDQNLRPPTDPWATPDRWPEDPEGQTWH